MTLSAFHREAIRLYYIHGYLFTLTPIRPVSIHSPKCRCTEIRMSGISNGVLICKTELVMWLTHDQEEAFDPTGHYPVLAGYDMSGNALYIACVAKDVDFGIRYLTVVAEGSSTVSYVDFSGSMRTTSRFHVLALRYNPCQLDLSDDLLSDAIDPTGPVYWKATDVEVPPAIDVNAIFQATKEGKATTSLCSSSSFTVDGERRPYSSSKINTMPELEGETDVEASADVNRNCTDEMECLSIESRRTGHGTTPDKTLEELKRVTGDLHRARQHLAAQAQEILDLKILLSSR